MAKQNNQYTAREHVNRRISELSAELSSWNSHYLQLVESFMPRRGKFVRTDRNRGARKNNLINNTPLFARRTLASGLMTGVTSPARPWFKLVPGDPNVPAVGVVSEWLETVEKKMYQIFASSNLYKALPTLYSELGVVGTACIFQDEDFENVTRFTTFTVGEYMIGLNGELKVDTFAREYQLTVYQVVNQFGLDKVSNSVKDLYERGSYGTWVDVSHLIEPVDVKDFNDLKLPDKFKFRSIYWEPGATDIGNKFLRVKGYEEFPVHSPRWQARAGDTYGESPGMEALGDARALQVQEKEKGKAIAKMVAPPTLAPSTFKGKPLSVLPGANNFGDDPSGAFRPVYQVDPRVNELTQDISLTEQRINRAFFVDMFLMIQNDIRNQRATATEIAERHEEKLLMLGPVLESLHDELLDPLIDRTFNMIVRLSEPGWAGKGGMIIPPPPKELTGSELKVEYISILANAQKSAASGSIEHFLGFAANLAQLKPEALDKLDADGLMDTMSNDLSVPQSIVLSTEEVKGIREQRAQQQQQQQQQEQSANAVDVAHKASQIDMSSDNPVANAAKQLAGTNQ